MPPRPAVAPLRERVRSTVLPDRRTRGNGVAGDRPLLRLVPLLVLLTLLTRLPSATRSVWNPDEGFLATQARQLAAGGTLYETVVDRKPPLLPWLYQGAFALFGDGSLLPLRAAAALAVLAGALLTASLAGRRLGPRAARSAGVLYVLLCVGLNPEDTQAATFEVFMLPWTAAAVCLADRGRWATAGLCVAGAALTKQTGGAVLVPVLLLLPWSRPRVPGLLRLLGGCAGPLAAVAAALGPPRFLFWTATGSGRYLTAAGAGLPTAGRAAASAGLLALAAAPVLWALLRSRRSGGALPWVWFAASAAAVCVGFQFHGHYFLQLVPALALLGAAALDALGPRTTAVALTASGVLAAGFTVWGLTAPRAEQDHAERVARTVRHLTGPDERVLLWGIHPEGYWLSGREPASRYLTAGFLTNFSGGGAGQRVGEAYGVDGAWDRLRGELAVRPPSLVVDDSRGAPYGVARTPSLRTWLDAHCGPARPLDGADLYRCAAPVRRG